VEPYEGVVLVCSPPDEAPEVIDDDLSEIESVETPSPGVLVLTGHDARGGSKSARIRLARQEYEARAFVEAPPEPIGLEGPFAFRIEPTMDNQWGDYRYPASPQLIGAEARRFRYREEGERPGTELGWESVDFDDADWPEVTYTYGPYWRHVGPFQPGAESAGFLELAMRGDRSLPWNLYSFSKRFGAERPELVGTGTDPGWEHVIGVSDNFLVLGDRPADAGDPRHHYLFTTITAPTDADYALIVGRSPQPDLISLSATERLPYDYRVPAGSAVWIDGQSVLALEEAAEGNEVRTHVRLRRGPNAVLVRVVESGVGAVACYVAFQQSDSQHGRFVPLLRWFVEPQTLVYDVTADRAHPVGWYRFSAPPGLTKMHLKARARAIEAWVDGRSVAVDERGTIALDTPRSATAQIALRVEQEPGTYAGSVFDEPVTFECDEGVIPLGDWSRQGLATYSGIGVYRTEFTLAEVHHGHRVQLDLGDVKTVAEVFVNGQPAGVRMARPFRVEITNLVHEGANRLEIKVANTLANHMSTYPTIYVFEGQTTSGLLGPVELRFLAPVRMEASAVG
jgi:hypothetical protein